MSPLEVVASQLTLSMYADLRAENAGGTVCTMQVSALPGRPGVDRRMFCIQQACIRPAASAESHLQR